MAVNDERKQLQRGYARQTRQYLFKGIHFVFEFVVNMKEEFVC